MGPGRGRLGDREAGMSRDLTVREVAETCHAHPTLSEALMEAALAAEGRAINF